MKEMRRLDGVVSAETFMLRPWVGLSDSSEFSISMDIILTIGNAKRGVQKQYETFLTYSAEAEDYYREQEESRLRSDAAEMLIRELSPNKFYRIVDDPYGEG